MAKRALALVCVVCMELAFFASNIRANPLVLQGSTTVTGRVFGPLKGEIETASGQSLSVIPNRSELGLLALLHGEADIAMISSSLEKEIALVKQKDPTLQTDRLRGFELLRTRPGLAVHPDNSVTRITRGELERVLRGEVKNWRELGGADLPIRLVAVRDGGGTLLTLETQLLKGAHVTAADVIRVQNGSQVITVVEQEAGALGISQVARLRGRKVVELAVDHPVEQVLMLVTLGEPTAGMTAVINAARIAAAGSE